MTDPTYPTAAAITTARQPDDHIIGVEFEHFLDRLSTHLIGSDLLLDISYRAVGALEDGQIIIEVTGDPSMHLDHEADLTYTAGHDTDHTLTI